MAGDEPTARDIAMARAIYAPRRRWSLELAEGLVFPDVNGTLTELSTQHDTGNDPLLLSFVDGARSIEADFEVIVEGDHWQEQLYRAQGRPAILRADCDGVREEYRLFLISFDLRRIAMADPGFRPLVNWSGDFDPAGMEPVPIVHRWQIRGHLRSIGSPYPGSCDGPVVTNYSYVSAKTFWIETFEAERRKRQAEADAKAESLLISCLSPDQRRDYESTGTFAVAAPSGRRYRLRKARSFNVEELDKRGRVRQRLCTVPGASVPMADQLLAQKLWIEADEKMFRRKANKARPHDW